MEMAVESLRLKKPKNVTQWPKWQTVENIAATPGYRNSMWKKYDQNGRTRMATSGCRLVIEIKKKKILRPRAADNKLALYTSTRRSKNDRNRHLECTPGGAQGKRAKGWGISSFFPRLIFFLLLWFCLPNIFSDAPRVYVCSTHISLPLSIEARMREFIPGW
jgi:hypothetical protein